MPLTNSLDLVRSTPCKVSYLRRGYGGRRSSAESRWTKYVSRQSSGPRSPRRLHKGVVAPARGVPILLVKKLNPGGARQAKPEYHAGTIWKGAILEKLVSYHPATVHEK